MGLGAGPPGPTPESAGFASGDVRDEWRRSTGPRAFAPNERPGGLLSVVACTEGERSDTHGFLEERVEDDRPAVRLGVATRHDDGLLQDRVARHAPSVVARPLKQSRPGTHPLGSAVPVVLVCLASGRWASCAMRLSARLEGHGCALAALPLGLGMPTHWHDEEPLATLGSAGWGPRPGVIR
jgi:hypothetical protein